MGCAGIGLLCLLSNLCNTPLSLVVSLGYEFLECEILGYEFLECELLGSDQLPKVATTFTPAKYCASEVKTHWLNI